MGNAAEAMHANVNIFTHVLCHGKISARNPQLCPVRSGFSLDTVPAVLPSLQVLKASDSLGSCTMVVYSTTIKDSFDV